jgi:hypothetical protein
VPEQVALAAVPGVRAALRPDALLVDTLSEGTDADPPKLLDRANEALDAAGHTKLGVREIARTSDQFPAGVTGKVLKRQLRGTYASLRNYAERADSTYLASLISEETA